MLIILHYIKICLLAVIEQTKYLGVLQSRFSHRPAVLVLELKVTHLSF